MEHTAGVAALQGLTANPESPASVAVSRPSDVLVARVAVAQTATALLLEASGSEEANAGVRRSTKIASVGMSFVALLRGIAPTNPNMRNDRLRGVFEDLGFSNVRTVLSSGNVLFETHSSAVRALETKVEEALPKRLGFTSTTIIRSRTQIQALVDQDPFGGVDHSSKTNLNVTFLKRKPRPALTFPYQRQDRDYTILGMYGRDICSVIDLTSAKTPDLMQWMEKEFGEELTTRTFNTVERILRRLNETD